MMLIGDGVTPGNEGRGYVLRRLLRRAVRSVRLLGYEDPALPELLPVSRDRMGETYAELHADWERISRVAYAEEEAFRKTLQAGTQIFDLAAGQVRESRQHRPRRRARLRAARHLRLPDRPDPGDGLRGRPERRRGGLPRADGRAARAGQGRRAVQEGPARRPRRLPRRPRRARPDRVAAPTRPSRPSRARSRCSSAAGRCRRWATARSASWCSTAPRSTPSPAARPPTPAPSSSTAAASRSSTCSARCAGWSCTRCASSTASSAPAGVAARPGRPRVAHRRAPGPLRHPRRARRAARGARPLRAAGRLLQPPRLPAPRLRLALGAEPEQVARRRAGLQPGAARRPRRVGAVHVAGRGQGVGRDRAVRRDLRRRGRCASSRSAARGRASCAAAPTSSTPRRSAPSWSPARPRWARATAASRPSPASRASPTWRASATSSASSPACSRPSPTTSSAGSATSSSGCARPRRRSRRSASPSCWPPRATSRPAPSSVGAVRRGRPPRRRCRRGRRPHPGPRRPRPAARRRARCRRRRSASADGKVSVVAAVNDAARERGVSANDLVRAVGPLLGGKGGGKDDVAQGGGTDDHPHRRGPGPGPLRGGRRRHRGRRLMRAGVRLGIDPGDARIGVARSDPSGFLATPRRDGAPRRGRPGPDRRPRGATRAAPSGCVEVVVGLPRSLSGGEGPAAREGARLRRPAGRSGWPPCRCAWSTSG